MANKRIYLSAPHMSGQEESYIHKAFQTNWIAPLGPNVDRFEEAMKCYTKINDAVALSAGTAAIHLALILLDVQAGDTVFCSSLTFSASANPILYQGANPIFIDSDEDTWNMSPLALQTAFEEAVKSNHLPKALIVVNLYGQSADMDAITKITEQYGVPVIEDAAESLGTTYKGQKSGTLGKFGIYSFNGNKIITTSGGGMLISNDAAAIQKARFYATQAREPARHYQHEKIGYNYRMSNIVAGIGRAQMQVLDERVAKKREIFAKYKSSLKNLAGLTFMEDVNYGKSNKWLTVIRLEPKESPVMPLMIMEALEKENIESRPVWKPMHLQPVFKDAKYYPHPNGSVSHKLFVEGVCLPSGTGMGEEEHSRVIEIIQGLWE